MIKVFWFVLLAAGLAWPSEFATGQAARLLIGQRHFTAQDPVSSDETLGAVSGIALHGDTLIVADSNRLGVEPVNHRVLIYRNLSSTLPAPTDELPRSVRRCPVCLGTASVVLGQPDFTTGELKPPSQSTMRSPVGVATDGVILAVADTDHNRVLIWNRIPQSNNTPADVVLGQPDFTRVVPNEGQRDVPTNRSFRGPQGIWIQAGKLFVADTGNNRILIWNSIPRSNFQPADLVVGQPNFNTFVPLDISKTTIDARADSLLTPVAVSSDGQRMFVTDLGHNRVLIWNSIPTSNNPPANLVVGQPDFTQAVYNNSSKLCESVGKDADDNDLFPESCSATLAYPRFALSDGRRLFIADGGNDRILVFNNLPTQNGASADAILGQISERVNIISDSAFPRGIAASNAVRTPLALAWDGANLFATDPFNRRIMVFTLAEAKIPFTGVRNAASREIYAVAGITFSGEVKEGQEATIKIKDKEYKYKAKKDDGFEEMILGMVELINAGSGDPNVFATPNLTRFAIVLTARIAGAPGNSIELSASVSTDATIQLQTSGATLSGGQDAAQIAPGTIVSIFGEGLAETTMSAPPDAQTLDFEMGGVQVYFDGIRAPILAISPTEIRAQVPWEVWDSESANGWVRTQKRDGTVQVTTAVAVPVIPQNPGIFAVESALDPRPGLIYHGSAYATGTVSVDGTAQAGNVATVTIRDRPYSYVVQEGDTLASIRDGLIAEINRDPEVEAYPAGSFTRIRLRSRIPGPEGNGLIYSAKSREGDQVILTATTPNLCCANSGPVTEENPALPGETIILYATGLGIVKPTEANLGQRTGEAYDGPELNDPVEFVSSLAGGKTANVLFAGMKTGLVGVFEVHLELNSDLPTDPFTQVTIAQDIYVSNIVTFPVYNPNAAPIQ